MFEHKGEITKISGFENFQMKLMRLLDLNNQKLLSLLDLSNQKLLSLLDLNNHGTEMTHLAGLRILMVMTILVGVSLAIQGFFFLK